MYVVVEITPKNRLIKYCLQATIKKLNVKCVGQFLFYVGQESIPAIFVLLNSTNHFKINYSHEGIRALHLNIFYFLYAFAAANSCPFFYLIEQQFFQYPIIRTKGFLRYKNLTYT